jgi:hypothetical protein
MKSYFILFCALFLSACATQKPTYDFLAGTDFSKYQSYAWLKVDRQDKDSQRAKNQLVDKRIMNAVDKTLAAKGLQKVSDNPDMSVNYHVSVSEQEQQQPRGRISIGTSSYGRGSSVGFGVSMPVGGTRTYQEGTLVIDLQDAKSKDLLWQGWGSRTVRQDLAPDRLTALIDEVVGEIFTNYPPPKK